MLRIIILLSLLIVFAGCQKNKLSNDEIILQSLQGKWVPVGISCDEKLPSETKVMEQVQTKSELVIDGKKSHLRIQNGRCETITNLNVAVKEGLLIWSPAGVKKSTCLKQSPSYIGKLEFKVETNKKYLKIDPINRDSVPCGVLKRI